ncbi:MAG: tyrosine-protein phosphatase [Actinomycetota bacterium]
MTAAPMWICLEGAANVRDVGGLPAGDAMVQPGRLIRADNLQGLTPADVRELVEARQVTTVADLRTKVEVDSEGPGPLVVDGRVHVVNLSLFPEAGQNTDAAADAPVLLPWQERRARENFNRRSMAETYLRYLLDRPDSVVAALRLVAQSAGATIVHCAAGKDRTGVVIAMALDEVGADRDAIVEDYTRTGERLAAVLSRLASSPTYAGDVDDSPADRHWPRAETLAGLFGLLDADYGGPGKWLRTNGWTDEDATALRGSLLG